MSRTTTFALLKEAIRTRYDLPAFSSTTHITTTQINALTNDSLQGYYALLLSLYGDEYYSTSSTITASSATTAVPTRCLKILNLWWLRGTDDVVRIQRGSADDLLLANYASKTWTEYGPKYRLQGTGTILWLPTPSTSYNVRCDHVALPADLSADGDTLFSGAGWEQWVIADVCQKLAQREEKDPSVFMAERAGWEARILAQAPDRTEGEPLQLRDVTSAGMSAYALRNLLSQRY
jgi:hypothetical protein